MDTSRWAKMSPWRRTAMDPLTSPLLGSSPGRREDVRREEALRHEDVAGHAGDAEQSVEGEQTTQAKPAAGTAGPGAKWQHQRQKKEMHKQQRQQHEEGNQLLKEQHDQQQQQHEEKILQEQQRNQGQGQQRQQLHKQEQARQQKQEFAEHQLKNPAATAVGTQAASAVTPSKAGAGEVDVSPGLFHSTPELSEVGNTIKELQKLAQDMEERLGDEEFQVRLVAEPKEKLRVGETIMNGLLELDKLQSCNEYGREQRRVLAGQLNVLLDKVDALRTRGDIGSEP